MRYKGSIRKRLISIILLVTTLTTFIGYSSFVYWYMDYQKTQSLNIAKTVGLVLGQDIAKLILLNEISAAADISSKLKSFLNLNSMVLYNLEGGTVLQYSKNGINFKVNPLPKKHEMISRTKDKILKLYIDASYQETKLGYIQLNFQIETMWDIVQKNIKIIIFILLFMLLVSYFLSIYYSKLFINPILKLVKFLEKIELADKLKYRIKTDEKNEFGKLYEEVNTMLDRMEISHREQRIAAVAFETQSGMTITDADQTILQINKAFSNITGYVKSEVIGQKPSILSSGMHSKEFYIEMYQNLEQYHHWSGEIHNKHKNGTIYPEHLTIQAVIDESGNIIYYVASFIDLTKQKESEEKLKYLEQYDALTGLANRDLLIDKIQENIDNEKQDSWGTLISLNIRDFKIINDGYGHSIADLLLQQITKRIQDEFSSAKLIGKIGVDEFILWFDFIAIEKEKASIESKLLAQYLITILTQTFNIEDKNINIISPKKKITFLTG